MHALTHIHTHTRLARLSVEKNWDCIRKLIGKPEWKREVEIYDYV